MILNLVFPQQRAATSRLFPSTIHATVKSTSNCLISPSLSASLPSPCSRYNDSRIICFMSSSTDAFPFYGTARPPSARYNKSSPRTEDNSPSHYLNSRTRSLNPGWWRRRQQQPRHLPPLTPLQRLATLVHSSVTALGDPARADAVAAVGEVTGSYALSNILAGMMQDDVGRRILHERPLVDGYVAACAMEMLRKHNSEITTKASKIGSLSNQQHPNSNGATTSSSSDRGGGGERIPFGAAYGKFLQLHQFDPNERSSVRFISDPDLSYIMTRYRQCHDYFHVLTGLPPTVLGELALKWLELLQTGLPLAALSATAGAWGVSSTSLSDAERQVLWNVYLPWAVRVGGNMKPHALMCVYYEEEFETDLDVLRERVGIELAPRVD